MLHVFKPWPKLCNVVLSNALVFLFNSTSHLYYIFMG